MTGKNARDQSFFAGLLLAEPRALVIVVVPSHDRHNTPLAVGAQLEWVERAMDVCMHLFGGATAFNTMAGVFKSHEGKKLRDHPVFVECYAERTRVMTTSHLVRLKEFLDEMRSELDQEAVMLVIDNIVHFIS